MAIIFNQAVKHGPHQFFPGVPVAFEDDRAEEYFVAAGWADAAGDAPIHTYHAGSVEVDPETVIASTGRKVLEV